MCGIVGYVGRQQAAPILLEALHRLEYRGYDSAGIALAGGKTLKLHKAKGKVRSLEAQLPKRLNGKSGIAHTRWATHGEPSDINAHPHSDSSGRIAVVHNGIVENAAVLKAKLAAEGVTFRSETDTEVLAHLIARAGSGSLEENVRQALKAVEGAYGLAVLDAEAPEKLVVARNGSPVVLGIGDKEMFVASDTAALVRHTQQVIYLDDGEMAVVEKDRFQTSTLDAEPTAKTPTTLDWSGASYDKEGFAHFMRKEIAEQPESVARMLQGRLDKRFMSAHFGGLNIDARDLLDIDRVKILGCGSAFIAGSFGAQVIEQMARIPATAEPASEFRYRNPVIERNTLYVAVSQSGRNPRHLNGGAGDQAQGRPGAGHHQRGGQHHCQGLLGRHLSPCRPRGGGGLHQDLHLDPGGLHPARPLPGPHPRPLPGGRPAADRGLGSPARADR